MDYEESKSRKVLQQRIFISRKVINFVLVIFQPRKCNNDAIRSTYTKIEHVGFRFIEENISAYLTIY